MKTLIVLLLLSNAFAGKPERPVKLNHGKTPKGRPLGLVKDPTMGKAARPSSIHDLRRKIENSEQLGDTFDEEFGPRLVKLMDGFFEKYLLDLKKAEITKSEPAKDWDMKDWQGDAKKAWLDRLKSLEAKDRCDLLELAYAFGVWQVTTLLPTKPVEFGKCHFDSADLTDDIVLDRKRASWQYRYIQFVPDELFPEACRSLKAETKKRWDFIVGGTSYTGTQFMRPLGFALGMCGRSNHAHSQDSKMDPKELEELKKEWERLKNEPLNEAAPPLPPPPPEE